MENKIKILKEKLDIQIKKISKVKKEVGFSSLIKKYKAVKKDIFKINSEISKSKNVEKINSLNLELEEKKTLKEKSLSQFKTVEAEEKKLYSLKKEIDSLIKQLDKNKNLIDVKIRKNEHIIEDNEFYSNVKNKTKLGKEIELLKKEIGEHTQEIKIRKAKSIQSEEVKSMGKVAKYKIRELQIRIKKFSRYNNEHSKVLIEKLKLKNKSLNTDSKKIAAELKQCLDMIISLKEELSFLDEDEVNKDTSFTAKHLDVWYGSKQALFDINLELPKNQVISIIGPSGCGKSTFLRTLNRINDNIPHFKAKGKILLDGEYDIFKLKSIRNRYDKIGISTLRTKVGMIFQQPNPFPMSIEKNVKYGPKVKGIKNKSFLNELTEKSLKEAGIWEEVKDNLKALGTSLSGGQQQRLCIARAIANEPEILLMDEPTSALDPIAAKKIEDLILKLKENYTVIMVTHSMQQAQRISDKTAFFYQGKLIEYGDTKKIFEKPKQKETKDYVSGKFG